MKYSSRNACTKEYTWPIRSQHQHCSNTGSWKHNKVTGQIKTVPHQSITHLWITPVKYCLCVQLGDKCIRQSNWSTNFWSDDSQRENLLEVGTHDTRSFNLARQRKQQGRSGTAARNHNAEIERERGIGRSSHWRSKPVFLIRARA